MTERVWYRFYDPGVPHEISFSEETLVDFLRRAASQWGHRPALVFMNRTLTYAQLADQVDRLAGALAGLGVTRGTRVAVHMPNVPQFVIAYYAAQSLGAIAVPTNPMYTSRELVHQWTDAGCEVACTMDFLYAQRIAPVRTEVPVRQYLIARIPEYLGFPLNLLAPLKLKRQNPPLIAPIPDGENIHRFRQLIAGAQPASATPPDVDDISTLLYTGGTTGVSKGAALTHRNLAANVQQLRSWVPAFEDGHEVFLGALPFFHSYGLTVVMNMAVALAGAVVLIPNPRDIKAIVHSVPKHRITLFPAVPNHFNAINQYPGIDRIDLSTIKMCNSGSAPLPVDVLETFERLTGSKISEGFGLTETSPVTHSNPLTTIRKVGSIGIPLPSTDAKIVDPETGDRELPPNEVGELIVRGPQVMQGYWQRPDATAEMIRDGWLYTGDLARVDEDGFCFIEGRKKDMILCSGFNVYPDEIDRVLMSHPAVLEAATIGLPDPERGETVKSFIVLRPGQAATADDLMAFAREQLAAYKVPRQIEFLDELPKSSVLKVLRRELRERELRQAGRTA